MYTLKTLQGDHWEVEGLFHSMEAAREEVRRSYVGTIWQILIPSPLH